MQINLQAKNMELTSAIGDYVEKRVTNLGKFLSGVESKGGEVKVFFDVAKTTNHHKGGEVFQADCSITIDGKKFHAKSEKSDLYEAVDCVKENLFHEITRSKTRQENLFRRGARSVKKMMKGLSDRNPLTSKY